MFVPSPSTVILVIVGGMIYSGIETDEITMVILLSIVTLGFALICLFTSQDFQLKVAKVLTFVFAIIMCMVTIGVAEQIALELQERENISSTLVMDGNSTMLSTAVPLELQLPAGISTLYLAVLVGIFIISAICHPKEWYCLLHGVWYLLCLPSGYLLLTIYSICNITDRSWGKSALCKMTDRKTDVQAQ